MVRAVIIFFLGFHFLMPTQAQTADIEVNVYNIKQSTGNLKLGVFDKVHNFRTKSDPYLKSSKNVTDSIARFSFYDVPYGRYAIAVYHDENNDDTLNTRKLGIPTEGIGFSGKFNSRIKPPDFVLASFRLKNDTLISINLIYHKQNRKN